MIGSFRSKALRNLCGKNDSSGVNPNALSRIKRILSILEGGVAEAVDLKDYHGS